MEDIIKALLDVVRIQHTEVNGTEVEPFNMSDVIDMAMNIMGRPEDAQEEKDLVKSIEKTVESLAPDIFPPKTFDQLDRDEQVASAASMIEQSLMNSGRRGGSMSARQTTDTAPGSADEGENADIEAQIDAYNRMASGQEAEEDEFNPKEASDLNNMIYNNFMQMMGLNDPQVEYAFDRSQIRYGKEKTVTQMLEEEEEQKKEEPRRQLSAWELAQNAIDKDIEAHTKEEYVPKQLEMPNTLSASQIAAEAIARAKEQDAEKSEIEKRAEALMEEARRQGKDPMQFALHQQEILQYMERNSDELVSFEDYEDLTPEEKYRIEQAIEEEKRQEEIARMEAERMSAGAAAMEASSGSQGTGAGIPGAGGTGAGTTVGAGGGSAAGADAGATAGAGGGSTAGAGVGAGGGGADTGATDRAGGGIAGTEQAVSSENQPELTEEMLRRISAEVLRDHSDMILSENADEDMESLNEMIMANIREVMSRQPGQPVEQESVDSLIEQVVAGAAAKDSSDSPASAESAGSEESAVDAGGETASQMPAEQAGGPAEAAGTSTLGQENTASPDTLSEDAGSSGESEISAAISEVIREYIGEEEAAKLTAQELEELVQMIKARQEAEEAAAADVSPVSDEGAADTFADTASTAHEASTADEAPHATNEANAPSDNDQSAPLSAADLARAAQEAAGIKQVTKEEEAGISAIELAKLAQEADRRVKEAEAAQLMSTELTEDDIDIDIDFDSDEDDLTETEETAASPAGGAETEKDQTAQADAWEVEGSPAEESSADGGDSGAGGAESSADEGASPGEGAVSSADEGDLRAESLGSYADGGLSPGEGAVSPVGSGKSTAGADSPEPADSLESAEARMAAPEREESPEEDIEVFVLGEHTQAEVDDALRNLDTLGLEGDVYKRAERLLLLELAGSEAELDAWLAKRDQKSKPADVSPLYDQSDEDVVDFDDDEFDKMIDDSFLSEEEETVLAEGGEEVGEEADSAEAGAGETDSSAAGAGETGSSAAGAGETDSSEERAGEIDSCEAGMEETPVTLAEDADKAGSFEACEEEAVTSVEEAGEATGPEAETEEITSEPEGEEGAVSFETGLEEEADWEIREARTSENTRTGRKRRTVIRKKDRSPKAGGSNTQNQGTDPAEEAGSGSSKEYQVSVRSPFVLKNSASFMDSFEEFIADTQENRRLSTGFKKLDAMLRYGLHKGSYYIGSDPLYLKNAFIQQIADRAAESGVDVLYISTELSRYDLMIETVSRLSYEIHGGDEAKAVSPMDIMIGREGANLADLKDELNWYRGRISEHLFIVDQEAVVELVDSMEEASAGNILEELIRSIVREGAHKPVVVIDNLENIIPVEDSEELKPLMEGIRKLAAELGIPILMSCGYAQAESDEELYPDEKEFYDAIGSMCDVYLELTYADMITEDRVELNREDIREMIEDGEAVLVDVNVKRNRRTMKASCQIQAVPKFNSFAE